MQGKSYEIDGDVKNELMHEIIKGLELVFKYHWFLILLCKNFNRIDYNIYWLVIDYLPFDDGLILIL